MPSYCIVSVTAPELVTCWVEEVLVILPPPQPILNTAAVNRTSAAHPANQIPRAINFLLIKARGTTRKGRRIAAPAAPDTVSVKITVT